MVLWGSLLAPPKGASLPLEQAQLRFLGVPCLLIQRVPCPTRAVAPRVLWGSWRIFGVLCLLPQMATMMMMVM
eukprot:10316166-Karenia_brevis.AAC.1